MCVCTSIFKVISLRSFDNNKINKSRRVKNKLRGDGRHAQQINIIIFMRFNHKNRVNSIYIKNVSIKHNNNYKISNIQQNKGSNYLSPLTRNEF